MNRGSEWRQWDLHFHTPSSYDYEVMSVTDQDLVDGLVNKGVSAVAITDHHVIDVARIRSLQAIGNGRLTVFPGIEFLSEARGKEPVHFIAIFSDKADIEYIWAQIENRTNIHRIKGEGKQINEVYCDLIDTCKLVHELGGVVTIHAGSKSNGIDKITNSLPHYEAMKEDISQNIDIYDMGKEDDMPGYKRFVFPSIGRVVPMVICSDNHNIRNYQRKQKLWIKADTTFDGLKQIIFEPEERVAVCATKPDDKSVYNVIDHVSLSEPGFWEGTIYFNQNLNTIIGGRSTGKSSLLDAIAAKHNCPELNKNDHIWGHINNVSIGWADGNSNLERDIEFLPQSYMHEIAQSTEKTNKLVEKIILHKDIGGLLNEMDSHVQADQKVISEGLFNMFNLYDDLKKELQKLAENGVKDGVKQQIAILKGKIDEIQKNSTLTVDENTVFQSLAVQLGEKKKQIEKAEQDLLAFIKLRSVSPIKANFENENSLGLLAFNYNAAECQKIFQGLKVKTEEEWVSSIDKIVLQTNTAKCKLEDEIRAISQNESYKKGIACYASNKELKELNLKLENETKHLQTIEQLEMKITNLRSQLNSLIKNVLTAHLDFKVCTQKVVDYLTINAEGLVIKVSRVCKNEQMRDLLENRFNLRGYSRQDYLNELVENYEGDTESKANNFLLDLIKGYIDLKGSSNPLSLANEFLSTNWFSLNYELNYQGDSFERMSEGKQAFVILKLLLEFSDKNCPILIDQPEDSLDNRAIYNDLVAYIKKKKKMRQIILVTHNSNVVVSADAENVIVANQNGVDSPNEGNNQFMYVNGSLETTSLKDGAIQIVLKSQSIREHVCDILEGGRDAFEKREMKYGFK